MNFYKMPEGQSVELKLQYLEDVINGLAVKVPRTITTQIPPIPLSHFSETVSAEQPFFRYIFPVAGEIVQAAVHIENRREHKKCVFTARLMCENSEQSEFFVLERDSRIVDLKLPIKAGSRLIVSCEQSVENVWVGLLFRVSVNKNETLQFALSQMEEANARIHNQI